MKKIKDVKCIACLIVLSILICSCNRTKEITPSFEFAPYISAYTGGIISSGSGIRIEFTQEQSFVTLDKELEENYFSFTPSLKGKVRWINNKTIEFLPDSGSLISGKLYNATFHLGKLMKVDKKFRSFKFSFRVLERSFSLETKGIEVFSDNPDNVNVIGELCLSDIVSIEAATAMISASYNGKLLHPLLESTDDPFVFTFIVKDIAKASHSSTLQIFANGKVIGCKQNSNVEVKIPGKNDFAFYSAKLITNPENGIRLYFTEAVSELQNLEGLIHFNKIQNYVMQIHNNMVDVYFMHDPQVQDIRVDIDKGLRNTQENQLEENVSFSLHVQVPAPEIKLFSKGTIMPDSKNLIIPFKTVSLQSVDVRIIRIYETNILMYLQNNRLEASKYNTYDLKRAGRLIYKKKLLLQSHPSKSANEWQNYSIDLQHLIKQEPGAIYRVEFSFSYEDASTPFNNKKKNDYTKGTMVSLVDGKLSESEEEKWDSPYGYYNYDNDFNWEVYRWNERDNPYHPTYYMIDDRVEVMHVLASNVGIVSKSNADNTHWVTVTNLLNAEPIANAEVTFYSYQLQVLGTAKTDKNGFAIVKTKNKPFVVTARIDKENAFLRLVDGEENALNRFDVGGSKINKGLKGFIYGERGVWRPGDTLFLSFILKDPEKKIPSNHPVILEFYNPRGQFVYKIIKTNGINGFYTFQIPTGQNDPTGIWNAYIKVGGVSFHKSLRIETIKPNRLKINLKVPGKKLIVTKDGVPLQVYAAWLTGLKAENLKTKVEMTLSNRKTTFKGFKDFVFTNPAAGFQTYTFVAYQGVLDAEGKTSFNLQTPVSADMPGMMSAQLLCRVFEPGGDASMYVETLPFSPFSTYVGINFNNDKTFIETDVDKIFNVVTLNQDGKLVDNADLEYKIYKIQWNWWWENNDENLSSYINNTNLKPLSSGKLKTTNGKAAIKFRINYPEWGRYFVYVKDRKGQHASGGVVYVDWPEWRGRSKREDPSGIKMLTFSTDKTSYENGETATIILPIAAGGKALVAIENGSQVLHREWIESASKGDTKYQFKITEEMAPNVYVHITFLQAHAQTINDLPIRMYGVIPVFVNNKQTKLLPELIIPSIVRPEQSFSIKVKEKNGKAMTYTLAIVDDGLLDLTNFKTPDPWSEFYAREALGIRTWDMYDDVIGAYSGNYGMLFTIGGDAALKPANAKANRFKPVVRFLGPFVLKKGEMKIHTVKLPPYMGSIRVMLIAGQDAAYGNAEKTIFVRSPLMVLSSLPRVVSINEQIELPVNVFAMEKSVKKVDVTIRTTGKLKIAGKATQSTTFTTTGDKLVYFTLQSGGQTGIEKITVIAKANGMVSSEIIELDVRNPNPPILTTKNKLLNAGEEVDLPYVLENNYNGNWLKLEASRIPFVDISRRLDFIFTYSHYCSEQLISTAFPLLYALQLDKNTQDAEKIKKHVNESISQLYARQLTNGGFSFWPGQQQVNTWVTSYAGNFLIIAKEKGYEVNQTVINKWIAYQRKAAKEWKATSQRGNNYMYDQEDFEQAYRLYTLAMANAAEMGAMNRLKERKDLSIQAKWRLAAAYAICGKTKIGNDMVFNVTKTINPYSSKNTTFGSSDRDEAMILEAMILLGKLNDAFQQAKKVSENLRNESTFSTQSTAYALIAMGCFAEKMAGNLQFDWTVNGVNQETVKTANVMFTKSLKPYPLKGSVHIKNRGTKSIYVSLISKTVPFVDNRPSINHKLKVEVMYTSMDGKKIDVAKLKQGTDFMAIIRIYNTDLTQDYTNLALTHILPSGWEILNERMLQAETGNTYTYQDIRDDRVLTYFDLQRGKSIVVKVRLQATYCGSFLLPAILCEPMYHANAQARTAAGRVMVVK